MAFVLFFKFRPKEAKIIENENAIGLKTVI